MSVGTKDFIGWKKKIVRGGEKMSVGKKLSVGKKTSVGEFSGRGGEKPPRP